MVYAEAQLAADADRLARGLDEAIDEPLACSGETPWDKVPGEGALTRVG